MQEVGDTVCFPVCTAHLVLSANENESWHVLLTHKILHSPAMAAILEIKCWNRTRASKKRIQLGSGPRGLEVFRDIVAERRAAPPAYGR